MKKVLSSAVFGAALVLSSCGDSSEEKSSLSVCDCLAKGEKLTQEMMAASNDEDALRELEEKYKVVMKDCDEMFMNAKGEEKEKLRKEMESCK